VANVRGLRHALRNFTASAVKEHLRSQVEDAKGPPQLTENEIKLVRFIREGSFDWEAVLGHDPPRTEA
jgi:hypothetical protein